LHRQLKFSDTVRKNGEKHPFFGRKTDYRGSVPSLDRKWHVKLYDVKIYFFGIRIASFVEEKMEKGPLSVSQS